MGPWLVLSMPRLHFDWRRHESNSCDSWFVRVQDAWGVVVSEDFALELFFLSTAPSLGSGWFLDWVETALLVNGIVEVPNDELAWDSAPCNEWVPTNDDICVLGMEFKRVNLDRCFEQVNWWHEVSVHEIPHQQHWWVGFTCNFSPRHKA